MSSGLLLLLLRSMLLFCLLHIKEQLLGQLQRMWVGAGCMLGVRGGGLCSCAANFKKLKEHLGS